MPKNCTFAATGRCIATGAYGSVSLSPHVLRPGSVLKAKVTPGTILPYPVITFDLVPESQPEGAPSVVSDYAVLRSSMNWCV